MEKPVPLPGVDAHRPYGPGFLPVAGRLPDRVQTRPFSIAIIFFKYARQLISRDADAGIPNFNPNLVAGASATQKDFPSIGVSDGIRQ